MNAFKYALLGLIGIIGLAISTFGPVKIPYAEALAKSYYRYAFVGLLFVLLLVSLAAGLFILTFDANNFKAEIVQFVKVRTQRDLVLHGNIKVTFFPKLGLDSGHASLSQRNSAKEFASINNARLYVAWFPLFTGKLVFDHVEIDGVTANVVRLKDRSTNYDDLLVSDQHLAPLSFDIFSVRITNSAINWLDETESQRVTVQNLQIETGRLADMTSSQLSASFQLSSEKEGIAATVKLKSRLFFDRKAGRYEFADIAGTLDGKTASLSDILLNFSGSVDSHPAQNLLTAEDVLVTATAKSGARQLDAKLGLAKVLADKGNWRGDQFDLDVSSVYLDESLTATSQLPSFEVADKVIKAAGLVADFDFKDGVRSARGRLSSELTVNLQTAPKLQFDTLALGLFVRHPLLLAEVSANTTGNLRVDFSEQSALLNFNSTLDDSKLGGRVALKNFSQPVYTFEVAANRLDLDRYLAADWSKHFMSDAAPFPPFGLNNFTVSGSLRCDEIIMAKVKASKLSANIKLDQSTLSIAPLAAKLFGGTLSGGIRVSMQGTPQIEVKQTLKNFQASALLADTPYAGRLAGNGNLAVDLSSSGDHIGAIRKALSGHVSFALSRGALAGFDLRAALLEGKSELGSGSIAQIRAAKFTDKTNFSELNAQLNFAGGNSVGNRFEMKSPLIRTSGEGDFDPATGNIDYRLTAVVASAINRKAAGELSGYKGVTLPIRVTGTFGAPSIAFDFGAASGGSIGQVAPVAKVAAPLRPSVAKPKPRATPTPKK